MDSHDIYLMFGGKTFGLDNLLYFMFLHMCDVIMHIFSMKYMYFVYVSVYSLGKHFSNEYWERYLLF